LLDEGATNISLNYSDLAAFFLAGFARGLAGAFAFAGALAGALGALADRFCLLSKLTFKKFILIYQEIKTLQKPSQN